MSVYECTYGHVLCFHINCAESMRASSLRVWMVYLKKLTLDVNGRMGKWRLKLGASTRLVHVGRWGINWNRTAWCFNV